MDRKQILADIDAATAELARLTASVQSFQADPKASKSDQKVWEITNSLAMVVVKVYTGLETVINRIVKDIDGPLPDSASFHKKLLARAAAQVEGARGPIISKELHALLAHLMGFRHLVLKRYAVDIDFERSMEIYERAVAALPEFRTQVLAFVDGYLAGVARAKVPAARKR